MWLLRDLAALVGIVLSFWPLMILVIANGRRAMLGKKISPRAFDCVMQLLPMAEARLRFALHRQAYRALGWDPRAIRLDDILPITNWSDVAERFEAYRVSMMDLHAAAAFFLDEHRRLHRIRARVDANAVRAAHASTDALRAAQHELVGVAAISSRKSCVALMLSSAPGLDPGSRPSKHARGLTTARGPPTHHSLLATRSYLSAPARLRSRPHVARTSRLNRQTETPEGQAFRGCCKPDCAPDQLKPIHRPPAAVATQLRIDSTAISRATRPPAVASSR